MLLKLQGGSPEIMKVSELINGLENGGVEYALFNYFGRNVNSDDEKANKLWRDAHDAVKT